MTPLQHIPFWFTTDDEYTQKYSTLNSDISADICVIGGGITGVITAYALAKHGIKVVLVEKEIIGSGATGRNTGFILSGTVEHYNRAITFWGREKAKRVWEYTQKNHKILTQIIEEEGIKCDYEQRGSLILASTKQEGKEVRETYKFLSQDNFDCDLLSVEDCAQLLKSDVFHGAVRMTNDGGFHPVKFTTQLSRTLQKYSVDVYEKTEVIEVRSSGQENSLEILTKKGKIHSAMAVLTTNGYTSNILSEFKDLLVPVIGQAFVTEPIQKSMFHEVIYANFGYEYWRQLPDMRIMVGGFREHAKNQKVDFSDQIDLELLYGLHDYFTTIFPDTRKTSMTHAWAGTMGFSKDGFPLLGGTSSYPNLFICGGFTGHGLGFAGAIGFTAADLMVNGMAPEADLFHTNRFSTNKRNI